MPEFNICKRGYDPEEVDVYIDKLRTEYDHLADICEKHQARIQELEDGAEEVEDVARVMITAQAVARQIEQDAQEKANRQMTGVEQYSNQAKTEADQLVASAQLRAKHILEEAQLDAGRIVGNAHKTRTKIGGEFEKIVKLLQPLVSDDYTDK